MGQQIYLFGPYISVQLFKHGCIAVMDPVTIQWCKGKGVFITALVIAGKGMFGLVEFFFAGLDLCVLGAWSWIVAEGESGKFSEEPIV